MKALLIAPAEAPGLDPLAYTTPPALLPLLGAPLATPLLSQLSKSGISQIAVACRTRSAAYDRFLLDGRPWGLHLATLEVGNVASVQLTLEAVRALGFHDETLAVMPANCWLDADWPALEQAHRAAGVGVSELVASRDPTGILLIEPGAEIPLAEPRKLEVDMQWRPLTSWPEYWQLALDAMQRPEMGVAPLYPVSDEGLRLAPLARIDRDRCEFSGPVWLGPGARVDPGAVLRGPVWVGANCRVGPGVVLERCALERAAQLQGPLELRDTLVVANRAISMREQGVDVLDEASQQGAGAITDDLANLAVNTARRTSPVLEALRQ